MNHHPLHTNTWFAEHETPQGKQRRRRQPRLLAGARHERARRERLGHRQPRGRDAPAQASRRSTATPSTPRRGCSTKESTSKPDRGIVTVETKGINQRGEEVCYFRRKVMVWKREAAPAAAARTTRSICAGPMTTGRRPTAAAAAGFGRAARLRARRGRRTRPTPSTARRASSASGRRAASSTWPPAPASSPGCSCRRGAERRRRRAGGRRCAPSCAAAVPDVEALDGTAEAMPLGDASVDVVTVGPGVPLVRRAAARSPRSPGVLRPGGRPGAACGTSATSRSWVRGSASCSSTAISHEPYVG